MMHQQPVEFFNRRQFLQRSAMVSLMGLFGGTLASCAGTPFSDNGNVITYWNLFGGGDGARMVEMQQAFQQKYPEIDLRAVTLAWGAPYYTKVAMSAVGGSPPNVAIMHLSRLHTYAAAGLLEPIDLSTFSRYDIAQDDFLPAVWQRAQYGGMTYAVPLDTHPLVMYYNPQICKKAGLLDASGNLKPLQGPEAFIDAFKRVQQVTGAYGLSLAVQDVTLWRLFDALYSQLGGKVLSPDGLHYLMDEARAEQALSFMADLTLKSKIANPNIDYAGSVALFSSGKAGFLWDGEWEITTFQGTMPLNMVPFPNIFGGLQTWGDSHSFVFPRGATSDQATKDSAYQFVSTLLKDSLTWAKGGHIPAYLPVTQSASYQALKPQSNYAQDAAEAVLDPAAWFSGAGSQFETEAMDAFSAALSGEKSVVASLQQFRSAILKLISEPVPLPQSVSG